MLLSKDVMPGKVIPFCKKRREGESGIYYLLDFRGIWWSCRRGIVMRTESKVEGNLVLICLCVSWDRRGL